MCDIIPSNTQPCTTDDFDRSSLSINVGDTVKIIVYLEMPKGEKQSGKSVKEKTQAYTGTVISKNNTQHSAGSTITVRRLVQNSGCEKVFFLNSPWIKGVTVLTSAKVRRSKLYYLRERAGKSARLKVSTL
jgi:large subunit ribosomal protein L19